MLILQAACGCEIGMVRTNNEDNFFFDGTVLGQDNAGLGEVLALEKTLSRPIYFAVFDGMGGEAFGEEAAYLAAETLLSHTKGSEGAVNLHRVLHEANQKVCQATREHNMGDMGSTAVLMEISQDGATILNLGDSKAFLLREGYLEQISVDHNDQAILQRCGIQDRKPRLTQYLGIEPSEMIIEPHAIMMDIHPQDQFLLCSDGLTDMVTTKRIMEILQDCDSPQNAVDTLIKEAMVGGGRDNTTVIVCKVIS